MARSKKLKEESRADLAIRFIHTFCKVPEGEFVGQPLILEEFQQDFFRAIFDGKRKVRRAIWSMARKNAKTVTIACLVLVFLIGPEAKLNSQIVSAAMSKDQAALVFEMACKIIAMSPELSANIKIIPSKKTLIGLPRNVKYEALSADAKTKHGLSPLVVIFDELGQQIGPKSDFYDALVTAQGAHKDPLFIIISTQAANDSDLLSVLIDDAIESKDPGIVCLVHSAPENCDLMDEKAWAAANPALGKFRSLEDVRQQAIQAARMPSFESTFRNLILNQRVVSTSPFITRQMWKKCGGKLVPLKELTNITGGLDLSGKFDLSTLILTGDDEKGKKHAHSFFWTPQDTLHDRAKRDRAPYDLWVKQGWLETTPGSSVDYEFVAHRIMEIISDIDILGIAFDRWRMDILKKEFDRIGLSEEDLNLVDWGQGFKDMSPAIDYVEELFLNQRINHGDHPVLSMCAANARIKKDPAGNRKLDKMKSSGRIDGMVALAQSVGLAERLALEGNLDDFISNPIVIV